jgi:hypothetical protein
VEIVMSTSITELASRHHATVLTSWYATALEEGLVTAFAAATRDAQAGDGVPAATVYTVALDLGLDGAQVVGRVAEPIR